MVCQRISCKFITQTELMLECKVSCVFSLGPLVNKVKEFQVETIVETLCSNMLSDKEQLRDISSIGMSCLSLLAVQIKQL